MVIGYWKMKVRDDKILVSCRNEILFIKIKWLVNFYYILVFILYMIYKLWVSCRFKYYLLKLSG